MNIASRLIEDLFFTIDFRPYWNFRHFGIDGENVVFEAKDGTLISGMFMHAYFRKGTPYTKPRGTIFYAHSGERNMHFNLPQVTWLVANCFNVFCYDPRGCGKSPGHITLAGCNEDVVSAFNYLKTRDDIDQDNITLFGQRTGAYAVMHLAAQHEIPGVTSMIIESLWSTQKGYFLRKYGPGIGHVAVLLMPERENPIDNMRKIKIPLAIMVNGRDNSLPEKEVTELTRAAPKDRIIWYDPRSRFLNSFAQPLIWRDRFMDFAESHAPQADAKTKKKAKKA